MGYDRRFPEIGRVWNPKAALQVPLKILEKVVAATMVLNSERGQRCTYEGIHLGMVKRCLALLLCLHTLFTSAGTCGTVSQSMHALFS